ncbi:cytochrome c3 family protein [Bythopirellula goksoeyrii]|uniref:Class III cytochrome C family protein n=1 Tax=Bythopirellula goksoeyrii TaxID=1400387 RepID=A0A5B9Q9S1_9BACT|nr:cytochrome c3 family protein [Bythopirellula goksoeyrii]QEG35804.1 Class III cytochrome C family protein [Bythopirellula goksoeyrii]
MSLKWTLIGIPVSAGVILAFWLATPGESTFKQPAAWQRMAEPGALSAAHAHLESNCAACHTSVKGVETANCIICHANNESILQRQPTSFHANINSCVECHLEHQGRASRPTKMDHSVLAEIGLRQLKDDADSQIELLRLQFIIGIYHGSSPHALITSEEAVLDCATCHSNDDRHFQLFGQDCAQCHATDRWTIPEFRHPSPNSLDCAQCHQAPPSHYMMHFKMISARVAGKPHARVDQCFQCHQTTSWNDILGAGWYKHH